MVEYCSKVASVSSLKDKSEDALTLAVKSGIPCSSSSIKFYKLYIQKLKWKRVGAQLRLGSPRKMPVDIVIEEVGEPRERASRVD